jgi:hypothetical protein
LALGIEGDRPRDTAFEVPPQQGQQIRLLHLSALADGHFLVIDASPVVSFTGGQQVIV